MKNIFLSFFLIFPAIVLGQFGNNNSIKCIVVDATSGEPINGINIGIEDHINRQSKLIGETNKEGMIDLTISHTSFTLFAQDYSNTYLTKIFVPQNSSSLYYIELYKRTNSNLHSAANDFENTLNQLLEMWDWGQLSYKISSAVIEGKQFLEVGQAVIEKVPVGPVISIPRVFEMKLRSHDGRLGWELQGSLVNQILLPYQSMVNSNNPGIYEY